MRAEERRWKGRKSDTGWVQVTSSVTGTWGVQYRVLNGMITVMISGTVNTVSGSTVTYASGQIPTEFCPPVNARGGGFFANTPGVVGVTPAGDVTGYQTSGSTQSTVTGTVTYPVS